MNKLEKILMLFLAVAVFLSAGCSAGGGENSASSTDTGGSSGVEVTDPAAIEYPFEGVYGKGELSDEKRGFQSAEDISKARFYIDGEFADTFSNISARTDAKAEFYNEEYVKMVDYSGGMTYCLPADELSYIDYSIAHYRLQISLGDSVLTVSAENSNPYLATSDPWGIYRDEWLLRFIDDDGYISANGLERIGKTLYNDTEIKPGYDVYYYGIHIKDDEKIERPYYNIAVIRKERDNRNFGLFVMKSKRDRAAEMMDIIDSYSFVPRKGSAKNYFEAGKSVGNENWSEETAEYFNRLISEDKINWGVFSYSMSDEGEGGAAFTEQYERIKNIQAETERLFGYKYEIYPTYTHLRYGFPQTMAAGLAGGNGKNGKPVLQYTYQFTVDNNSFVKNKTPMFDILRGKYDGTFRRLARDIKNYGKPVLFRLNNEMNTDWTSYCGLVTLLDPDIFVMTWRRLYDIFEAEGVDNCIWIWNPSGVSCPYSSWGEDLCYFPGTEYVQMLGLTEYEMGNGETLTSFREHYQTLYEKNVSFQSYCAIISEFGCGSGGETDGVLGRNAAKQAEWVREMFAEINAAEKAAYIKQIKGAVWFNCNDYSNGLITNRLKIVNADGYMGEDYGDLRETIEAFRQGLNYSRG